MTPFCCTPAFCGSSCVRPSRDFGMKSHAQFRGDHKLAGLLVCFAENQPGRFPFLAVARAWSGQGDAEGLISSVLPRKMQGDDAVVVRFQFRPMAQRRPVSDSTSKSRGSRKLSLKIPARAIARSMGSQHAAIFAERKDFLGFDAHIPWTAEAERINRAEGSA